MRRSLLCVLLLLVVLPLVARPRKKIVPRRVACIGNSVTYGTGLQDPARDSYPTQLQTLLGPAFEVGRFGKPGATLLNHGFRPYMRQQEFHDALAFRPDIAVIHLGLNDTDPRAFPAYRDEFVADYLALIDSVRLANPACRIIIARMTPLSSRHRRFESGTRDWHRELQTYIETVARLAHAELIDFYEPLHSHPDWFPDAIHPTREGYGLLAQIVASAITGDYGGLRLPPAFTDHMVWPRERALPLSGTANAGDTVVVELHHQTYTTTADRLGRWTVVLNPLPTGGPYTLAVSTAADRIELHDILAGEVWLASGQSNMAFKLAESATATEDLPQAQRPDIRLLNYECRWPTNNVAFAPTALDSINHLLYFTSPTWTPCTPDAAARFSAIGYYFARALADSLQCPIGIIANAVGGSGIEAWVSRQAMEDEFPSVLRDWAHNDFLQEWTRQRALRNMGENPTPLQRHPYEPCYLYEASIRSLALFPIQGVIWYQGESNAHNKDAHARLFDMLVRSWRKAWANNDLPFYYVQLSSLNRPEWTWFRDSQRQLLHCEPHLGMAVSSDLGDSLNVHPTRKRPLGERLVRWALHNDYGRPHLLPSGPLPERIDLEGDHATVHFRYAEGLRTSDGHAPATFEVAEVEGLYHPAKAEIKGETIVLTCPDVPRPRYVRYAWQPFTRANLVNKDGLPATTFRGEVKE